MGGSYPSLRRASSYGGVGGHSGSVAANVNPFAGAASPIQWAPAGGSSTLDSYLGQFPGMNPEVANDNFRRPSGPIAVGVSPAAQRAVKAAVGVAAKVARRVHPIGRIIDVWDLVQPLLPGRNPANDPMPVTRGTPLGWEKWHTCFDGREEAVYGGQGSPPSGAKCWVGLYTQFWNETQAANDPSNLRTTWQRTPNTASSGSTVSHYQRLVPNSRFSPSPGKAVIPMPRPVGAPLPKRDAERGPLPSRASGRSPSPAPAPQLQLRLKPRPRTKEGKVVAGGKFGAIVLGFWHAATELDDILDGVAAGLPGGEPCGKVYQGPGADRVKPLHQPRKTKYANGIGTADGYKKAKGIAEKEDYLYRHAKDIDWAKALVGIMCEVTSDVIPGKLNRGLLRRQNNVSLGLGTAI